MVHCSSSTSEDFPHFSSYSSFSSCHFSNPPILILSLLPLLAWAVTSSKHTDVRASLLRPLLRSLPSSSLGDGNVLSNGPPHCERRSTYKLSGHGLCLPMGAPRSTFVHSYFCGVMPPSLLLSCCTFLTLDSFLWVLY